LQQFELSNCSYFSVVYYTGCYACDRQQRQHILWFLSYRSEWEYRTHWSIRHTSN